MIFVGSYWVYLFFSISFDPKSGDLRLKTCLVFFCFHECALDLIRNLVLRKQSFLKKKWKNEELSVLWKYTVTTIKKSQKEYILWKKCWWENLYIDTHDLLFTISSSKLGLFRNGCNIYFQYPFILNQGTKYWKHIWFFFCSVWLRMTLKGVNK